MVEQLVRGTNIAFTSYEYVHPHRTKQTRMQIIERLTYVCSERKASRGQERKYERKLQSSRVG